MNEVTVMCSTRIKYIDRDTLARAAFDHLSIVLSCSFYSLRVMIYLVILPCSKTIHNLYCLKVIRALDYMFDVIITLMPSHFLPTSNYSVSQGEMNIKVN